MPESGPGSYYQIMYEWINKHWKHFLEDQQDFKEVRTVTNRLLTAKWLVPLEEHTGLHCDYKSITKQQARQVVRNLMLVCQIFADHFTKTMTQEHALDLFLVVSRSCYPNCEGDDLWWAKNKEDLKRLSHLLTADMGNSILYDAERVARREQKEQMKIAKQEEKRKEAQAKKEAKAALKVAAGDKGKRGGAETP